MRLDAKYAGKTQFFSGFGCLGVLRYTTRNGLAAVKLRLAFHFSLSWRSSVGRAPDL